MVHKRIAVEIPAKLHTQLRIALIAEGLTLSDWMRQCIQSKLNEPKEKQQPPRTR